jgi:hypothetical protein
LAWSWPSGDLVMWRMRWRAASPAFRVPAQWPSRVAGARGVVEAGVGFCAVARAGEKTENVIAKNKAICKMQNERLLGAEIVPRLGAACCAPTSARLRIW